MTENKDSTGTAYLGPLPDGGKPKVKVLRKDRLNLLEKVGIWEVVKGMCFTLREMFKPRVTIQFPEEPMPKYPSGKGQPVLVRNTDESIRCVSCCLCEFVCPARAITIDPGETDRPIQKEPKKFSIDMLRCILCGMCEEACPMEAIVMSDRTLMADHKREDCLLQLEDLLVPVEQLNTRIEYIKGMYSKWKTTS